MALEAVAAFGFAANVLQFLEFTAKLLDESRSIYNSEDGSSSERVDMELVASQLENHVSNLAIPGALLDTCTIQSNPAASTRNFGEIASACQRVAKEIQQEITRLKAGTVQHKRWRSFAHAFKTTWNKNKLESLKSRMESLKSSLLLHLQVRLLDHCRDIECRMDTSAFRLEQKIHTNCSDSEQRQTEKLLKIVENSRESWVILQRVKNLVEECRRNAAGSGLLDFLRFDDIDHRESMIRGAHRATFEWMVCPSESGHEPGYTRWLQSQQQVFWVSGKPGSGKSTLMKFLFEHPTTQQGLKSWAGDNDVILAQAYFWCSGSRMQYSTDGFLRKLLVEILSQRPEISLHAFPELRDKNGTDRTTANALRKMTTSRLKRSLQQVIEELTLRSSSRLCFFLDGLDEHSESGEETVELIKEIASLAGSKLKLCLASRPWPIFEDEFGRNNCCKIYMENLTTGDVYRYVNDTLRSRLLSCASNTQAAQLIDMITTKARGVFLWVFLVVRSITVGLRYGDDFCILTARVDAFPSDLQAFFEHMLKSVDAVYLQQSVLLFKFAATRPENAILNVALCARIMDSTQAVNSIDIQTLLAKTQAEQLDMMKRRLFARSQGLLEIGGAVDFEGTKSDNLRRDFDIKSGFLSLKIVGPIHRTVKDFIQTKEIWTLLSIHSGSNVEAYAKFYKACLLGLIDLNTLSARRFYESNSTRQFYHFDYSAAITLSLFGREWSAPARPMDLEPFLCHLLDRHRREPYEKHDNCDDFKDVLSSLSIFEILAEELIYMIMDYLRRHTSAKRGFEEGRAHGDPDSLQNMLWDYAMPMLHKILGTDIVWRALWKAPLLLQHQQWHEFVRGLLSEQANPHTALFSKASIPHWTTPPRHDAQVMPRNASLHICWVYSSSIQRAVSRRIPWFESRSLFSLHAQDNSWCCFAATLYLTYDWWSENESYQRNMIDTIESFLERGANPNHHLQYWDELSGSLLDPTVWTLLLDKAEKYVVGRWQEHGWTYDPHEAIRNATDLRAFMSRRLTSGQLETACSFWMTVFKVFLKHGAKSAIRFTRGSALQNISFGDFYEALAPGDVPTVNVSASRRNQDAGDESQEFQRLVYRNREGRDGNDKCASSAASRKRFLSCEFDTQDNCENVSKRLRYATSL